MKLIVGLGNPGTRFARTRHNIGFRCVDHFARRHGLSLASRRQQVRLGTGQVEGTPIVLAQPRTFMNHSSAAISYLLRRFKSLPQDLVVVYDDLDLPVGKIRIRAGGSSGGHRGMDSIIQEVASQEIPRIRVGIGRPTEDEDKVAYVLSAFAPEEEHLVQEAVERVSDALLCIIEEGLEQAMNRYN